VFCNAENLGGTVQNILLDPKKDLFLFCGSFYMSDIIPTFTDDDTAYSWLQRVNISNRDLLYEYCGDEMEKEFSLLRSE
jgi:hypothetical protein